MRRRSLLLHGLRLVLRSPGALLWTYAFNLAFALIAGIGLKSRLNDILAHSLASERLTSAFDLGVLASAFERMGRDAPSTGAAGIVAPICYLVVFFLLVPGALVAFRTGSSSRLSALLATGLRFAGRFFLIALLTAAICGPVFAALFALYGAWSTHIDQTTVGNAALWLTLPILLVILVVGSILRLYFDLVEVYTVALAEQIRISPAHPEGRPDRRFYRVLLPAAQTLGRNFARATLVFCLLSAIGLAAVVLTGLVAVHTLAQPRTWPMFLLAQVGLFVMLLTRFWQRGAETILAEDNPLPLPVLPGAGPVLHPYFRPERTPLPPVPDFNRATPPPPPPYVTP